MMKLTNVNQLKRDIEIVKKALAVSDNAEGNTGDIRAYMGALDEATKDMSRSEKARFEHELARQLANEYQLFMDNYEKVWNPVIRGYELRLIEQQIGDV